jgi:phospho-N-acetylmuramoyl-pentapeptide-transferase
VAILATPALIRYFRRREIGQHIREDGPASHIVKAGTPTMGGIAIVTAVVIGYVIGHAGSQIRFSRTGCLAVAVIVAFGIIGFLDDWIKVRHKRSLGLNKRAKSAAQILCAVAFAELALHWAHTSTALSFTRAAVPGIDLGQVGWVIFAVLVMVGTSNAVNITDGVDGLAAGSSAFCFGVLAIIGYWIFRHLSIYHVPKASAIDLALVAVALAGACIGFLWWNAAPAKIIMGDTGSLALGSGLAALCLLLNLDLLLPIIGGLFVMETLSVIAQVISFRVFHRRIFRMAPIHHHFELGGWPETTVLVRFWILGGLFVAVGLGIFYADFLRHTGLAS